MELVRQITKGVVYDIMGAEEDQLCETTEEHKERLYRNTSPYCV